MALVVSHLFPSEMWACRSTLMRFPVGEMGQGCPRPGTSNLLQAKILTLSDFSSPLGDLHCLQKSNQQKQ